MPTKKSILAGLVGMLLVCSITFFATQFWFEGRRSLSAELVPTAEYLLANPELRPRFVFNIAYEYSNCNGVLVSLLPGRLMREGEAYNEVETHVRNHTLIALNQRSVSGPGYVSSPAMSYETIYGQFTGIVDFCHYVDLNPGVHLLEVTTSDLQGTEYTYTTAFRVP